MATSSFQPQPHKAASASTRAFYNRVNAALETTQTPHYILYLGHFEQLLEVLTPLIEQHFAQKELRAELAHLQQVTLRQMLPIYRLAPLPSVSVAPDLLQNAYPHLLHVYETNCKLAIVFVALRESIKGWLSPKTFLANHSSMSPDTMRQLQFVADQTHTTQPLRHAVQQTQMVASDLISIPETPLVHAPKSVQFGLEQYLQTLSGSFYELMKTYDFLRVRVEVEQMLVEVAQQIKPGIHLPFNILIKLTKQYPDFSKLLLMLYDQFPTNTTQKALYSAYVSIIATQAINQLE